MCPTGSKRFKQVQQIQIRMFANWLGGGSPEEPVPADSGSVSNRLTPWSALVPHPFGEPLPPFFFPPRPGPLPAPPPLPFLEKFYKFEKWTKNF